MNGDEREETVGRLRRSLEGRSEVLEAYLFGSLARGTAGPLSDVDVAVYVDPGFPRSAFPFGYAADLTTFLMSALGTDRVDVAVLNEAPPLLYHRVLRDGIRLLSRDLRATTVREGRAISQYCDFEPVLRRMDEALARRISRGEFGR